MIQKPTDPELLTAAPQRTGATVHVATPVSSSDINLTLFAIPKPFVGHIGEIQRNAIRSWAQLQPNASIILFGQDDPGLTAIADETGADVVPLSVNDNGTPLLADAFDYVHANCQSDLFCYINCDIIFGPQLLRVAERLLNLQLDSFLGIGQRTTWPADGELDMSQQTNVERLIGRVRRYSKPDSIVCKDYFLFTPDLFRFVPGFLVGRGNWDNWMVAHAKDQGVPVIDLTARLPAIHQQHDYSHVPGGRRNAYVFGKEARENQSLAGGRHLVFGSTPTWELRIKGLKKRRFPFLAMLKDSPKFLSLLRNLMILGYLLAGTPFSY